jgi:hypothetical protein
MRTRVLLAVAAISAAGVVVTPAARAAELEGDDGQNTLFGTAAADTIRGLKSNDVLLGRGGDDKIEGGTESDTLLLGRGTDVGNGGTGDDAIFDDDGRPGDKLRGAEDDDSLFSADGAEDLLDCGDGVDVAIADRFDIVRRCETVIDRRGEAGESGRILSRGTRGDDTIATTVESTVAALAGADHVTTGNDTDFVFAGPGKDNVNTAGGLDLIIDDDGAAGDVLNASVGAEDRVVSADGAADSIICGPDVGDILIADLIDTHNGCETVIVG